MRSTLSLTLIMLMPLFTVGQSANATGRSKLLMPYFNPGITYRFLNYENPEEWVEHDRNRLEVAKFGFDAGLLLIIPVRNRAGVRAGLQYSNRGYRSVKQPLTWTTLDPAMPGLSRSIVSYHSIGIPLEIQFTCIDRKRFMVNPFAGLSPEVLINTTTVLETFVNGKTSGRSRSTKSVGSRKIALNARAGVEFSYDLSVRSCVRFGVLFQYSITSRMVSSIAAERSYGAYTSFGFARRF